MKHGNEIVDGRQVLRVLDNVAGEADEIRLQCVDARHHSRQPVAVTLVMNVGEMNEARRPADR